MCRKYKLIAVGFAALGAGMLASCLIAAPFLRLLLGMALLVVGGLIWLR